MRAITHCIAQYENMHMHYIEIFKVVKNDNFQKKKCVIFTQNIDCGYSLEPPRRAAVLTSTHKLCLGAKLRKIGIPLHTLHEGYKGVCISRTRFPDGTCAEITFLSETTMLSNMVNNNFI